MSNNTFQPDRFYRLVFRNLKSIRKYWIQSLLIFAGIPLLFFLINLSQIGLVIDLQGRTSFLSGLVAALVIVSPFMLFFNYNHPKKGLTEVMLAASVFEKYLVMQLACLLLTPLAIMIIYGGMDGLLALFFPGIYSGYVIQQVVHNTITLHQITLILLLQQAILFFNLLFVRRKVVKTGGVFILTMIVTIAAIGITASFFESRNPSAEFNDLKFDFNERGLFAIYADDHPIVVIIQITRIFMQVIVPLALMAGSYFVMKNKRY